VRIRSEANARSYFGPESERDGTFDKEAFYPGDQGYLAPNRMLSISGDNNVVNLGGIKTTIERIEARFAGTPE